MPEVGHAGIFVQLLTELNWEQLRDQSVSEKNYISYDALN